MNRSLLAAIALAATALPQAVFAQGTTDSQQYSVAVDPLVSISAVNATVSINHDTNDTNQVFPSQLWNAFCNNSAGATVTFTTASAFQNVVGATTYTRHATLDLALGANVDAGWAIDTATATTSAGNETVSVGASTSGPGSAELSLTVTFLDTDYSTLPSGTYAMTVDGLITAN